MKKTQKALSIKKLQAELREEKQAELKRLVTTYSLSACFLTFSSSRRREVTAERKKAAEEKRRLEEAKAQVRFIYRPLFVTYITQMGARKAARLRRRAGRTKKINH